MKRTLLTIGIIALSACAYACPKPTAHCVVNVGCSYGYSFADKVNSKDNLGLIGKVGVETPMRYATISVVGGTAYTKMDWYVGGEVMLNPLGAAYGYDTPINFGIIVGGGYGNLKGGYTNVGLELSGRMGYICSPFARCTFDMNNVNSEMKMGVTASLGIRLWLGKGW